MSQANNETNLQIQKKNFIGGKQLFSYKESYRMFRKQIIADSVLMLVIIRDIRYVAKLCFYK